MAAYRASAVGDWPTYVRILHPNAQRLFREEAVGRGLVLEGDSVVAFDTRLPGSPGMSRPGPVRMAVRDLLETEAPGMEWSDFSDEQVTTLIFASAPRSPVTPARPAGTLDTGDGHAYVVLVPAVPTQFHNPGISETVTLEVRRSNGEWRLLVSSPGW